MILKWPRELFEVTTENNYDFYKALNQPKVTNTNIIISYVCGGGKANLPEVRVRQEVRQ